MPELKSTWALHHAVGEPNTIIRITNLQTSLPIATDAWGRRGLVQPVLISCAVILRHPFLSAVEVDRVESSTVNYGILSREILEACVRLEGWRASEGEGDGIAYDGLDSNRMSLLDVMSWLQYYLTGLPGAESRRVEDSIVPVLHGTGVSMLELQICLPKASLRGEGVTLKAAFQYNELGTEVEAYSMLLELQTLRMPALIGANLIERTAKQIVITTVEADLYSPQTYAADSFCELEQVIAKAIDASSFETLEALGNHIGYNIFKHYFGPAKQNFFGNAATQSSSAPARSPRLRIRLSKPTAVPFADAPTVEMTMSEEDYYASLRQMRRST